MSVLGIFCEDIDFPNGASVTVTTTTGSFRSAFARCALQASNGGQQTFSKSVTFTPLTSVWLSTQLNVTSGNYLVVPAPTVLGLGDGGQQSGIFLGLTSGTNIPLCLTLSKYDGTTVTNLATSPSIGGSGTYKIDFQIVNYGASGTVNIYTDGALALSYTGDLSIPGMASMDCVFLGGISTQNQGGGHFTTQWWFSEFIVADEPTLGWQGVDTREITANGTTQQWSNPDISNFDPITINDANSTYSNTAGQDEQAVLANSVAGNFAIKAVNIVARANAPAGSAVTNLKLGLRNGAGVVGVGAAHALTTAFASVSDLLTVDPTTGQPFTSIDGYQLDLRSA